MSKRTVSVNKEQDSSRSWDIRGLTVCWQEDGETTNRYYISHYMHEARTPKGMMELETPI